MRSNFGYHLWPTEKHKLWILMYHRVLPKNDPRFDLEEPGMIVTPSTLDMHLTELKKHFELVSLDNWVKSYEQGKPLPDKACAITFDDGWFDNYEYAMPILRAHQVPATVFAVAEKANTDFRFWPNIVLGLISMKSSKKLARHPMFEEASELARSDYSGERAAECLLNLKKYSEDEIFRALDSINWKKAFKKSKPELMGWKQLIELQDSGLITIGSHTNTHRRLETELSDAVLEDEIGASRTKLQDALDSRIDYFCFPNGIYNEKTLNLVRQNYRAAVTTDHGINDSETLALHELKRIALHDDISNTPAKFRARIAGW